MGDQVDRAQVPLPHHLQEERPHRGRRQQIELTLGLTESGKIERNEMTLLSQSIPDLSKRQNAFRPGAGEDSRLTPPLSCFGEADLDAVCFSDREVHHLASAFLASIGAVEHSCHCPH